MTAFSLRSNSAGSVIVQSLIYCVALLLDYAVICFTRRTGTRDLHRSLPWAETTTTASKTLNTLHLILLSFNKGSIWVLQYRESRVLGPIKRWDEGR